MKRNISYIISLLFILFTSTLVNAQMLINVDTCRTYAINHSEEMLIAQKQYEQALHQKKEQRSNYLPKISASGAYVYTDYDKTISIDDTYLPTASFNSATGSLEPNIVTDASGNPVVDADGNYIFSTYAMIPATSIDYNMRNSYYAGIAAEQPIYMGGKINTANKMASIGVDLYKLNISEQKQAITLQADKTYWTYVSVLEQIKVAQKYISLLDSLSAIVKNGVNAGLVHRNELLKVKVKRNEAQLKYDEAVNGKELLRMSLCRIMGIDLFTDFIVNDTVINIEAPSLIVNSSSLVENRTDHQMLEKQIELKQSNESLTRSDFLPQIGVRFSYSYLKTLELSDITGSFDINTGYLYNGFTPSLMATVSIPIFHWGEGHHKIKQAEIEKEIAQDNLQKSEKLMLLEINQAKLKLNQTYNRITATKENLEYAEENMKISRSHYRAGMELLTDYLEAQTQWQSAFSDYIQSKTQYKISETNYLKTIGKL